MGSYSLTTSINNVCGGVANSYITNGFVQNPIIAGMIVTFITMAIMIKSNSTNLTKLFVVCSLVNICYLFFHTHAITKSIQSKTGGAELEREFNNINTKIGGTDEEFKPPID